MYVLLTAMAICEELGEERSVALTGGTVRYRETGEGPPVVFVHGVLANADLWRNVVSTVSTRFRCIAPDWPLGAHTVPVPGADLTPPGVARLIAEFLAALDLSDVTIVANDTGGAITQLLMLNHPERIGRVVLTPSDCYDRFFPPPFNSLGAMTRVPGMTALIARLMNLRALRRLPIVFGLVTKRPIPDDIADSYLGHLRDPLVRRDLVRFVRAVNSRYTQEAAARLGEFTKPVLLAWATEDRLFPLSYAHRLAEALPDARLAEIGDSYTFVPEDQPAKLAELITSFVGVT
jgi:pimeloyl-ACP methyl ester carboxylesterase